MKRIVIIAVLTLTAIGLAGCGLQQPLDNERVTAGQNEIKIGWIGPLTGQSAVLGMDSVVAAQIAVDKINSQGGIKGKNIKLLVEDDQYNTQKTVDAYNKLVNIDGVKILLVNTYGGVFAIADKAKSDNILVLDPLDCNNDLVSLNSNIYCLATESESIAKVLAGDINSAGAKKTGILYFNSDSFMPLVKKVFLENFKGQVAIDEGYVAGTADFKTQLTKAIRAGAQNLVLLGYDELGLAMKQARELGFKGKFYGPGTFTSPGLQKASAGTSENALIAFWDAPKDKEPAKSFAAEFAKEQGRPAILDLACYPTYDAVNVIAAAISKGSTNIDDIKLNLLQIKDFSGVTGPITFAADRSVKIAESIHILKKGIPVVGNK